MFSSRLLTLFPWALLILVASYMGWDNHVIKAERDKAMQSRIEMKSSLELVVSNNQSLAVAVDELKKSHEEERKAALAVETYNTSVKQQLNLAVGEIKGLLNEEDSCGDERLPDSVIKRMWQHYGPRGRGTASDDTVFPTSSVPDAMQFPVRSSGDDPG